MLGSPEHCARALGRQVWSVLKCGDWMGVFGRVENVRLTLGFQQGSSTDQGIVVCGSGRA